MVEATIREAIQRALETLGYGARPFTLDRPADRAHGDHATNVALMLAASGGKDPRTIAREIVEALGAPPWAERIEVAGAGFINLYLARTCVRDMVREVLAVDRRFGAHETLAGKRIMVEYTQPNPFKPFHIGHLMSNTIGESLARLYEYSGAEVRRANYQGDVGLHVAKCLWGLMKLGGSPSSVEDLGHAYVEGNRAYEDDAGAKGEITAYNRMVYERAPQIAEAYRIGRDTSLAHFEDLYRTLGTRFDHYFFESESQVPGRALVKEGLADGVFVESEGAVVFRGDEHGLHTRVFLTSEGLPTYEAKELGLAQLKADKWPFDTSITVTAAEQDEYFKVVFAALARLRPAFVGKFAHVSHGMMTLVSGKMSSRRGNVVTGETLLEGMRTLAREKVAERDFSDEEKERIASAVAVAAIKYQILRQRTGKNTVFDPARALSLEGDSGPYLQYAYTRAVSVLEKASRAGVAPATTLAPPIAVPLERLFHHFPGVVLRARETHEPHQIATYLTELAATWNSWYAVEKILDDSPLTPYKLAIVKAFSCTMQQGLYLLGIEALPRM